MHKLPILFLLILALSVSCGGVTTAPDTPEPVIEQTYTAPEVITLAQELKPIYIAPIHTPAPEITVDPRDAELIAKTLAGEYFGPDLDQQAAVCWCILNRCDAWGKTVEEVVTQPNQFLGYHASNAVEPRLYDMAVDVLTRWEREKAGETDVGRILPRDYLWFAANSDYTKNIFRNAYEGGDRWDLQLPSPYEEAQQCR